MDKKMADFCSFTIEQPEKIPVLFVLFNRPELVQESIQPIARYRPRHLYLAADGPRPDRQGEAELCHRARAAALEAIDWECEVRTLFRDQNVGCGRGVSEAISWMLESEEYGAIVEDDCIVSCDFFRLCEEVLPLYCDDERVAQVSAFDPYSTGKVQESYFFASYPTCWGWATWRRAWRHIDFEMKTWPALRLRIFRRINLPEALICLWEGQKLYRSFRSGKPYTWDFQWGMCVMMERRLCLMPRANLARNVGMGIKNATNTHGIVTSWSEVNVGVLQFPLQHPARVTLDHREERHRKYRQWLYRYAELLVKKVGAALNF
ncbi:MAG: hypothetical protein LBJ57_05365 [Prevotellaceae bacterium]|jgi:hypothetical protein|nr:hypothetical protein [Prevotellaceae bacterium]